MNRIEDYRKKDFDQRSAEYFAGGRKRLVGVVPTANCSLILTFEGSEKRIFDMRSIIEDGTVFAFLKDPENFQRVYIDDTGCISWDIDPAVNIDEVWSNKVGLSSDSCYIDSQPLEAPHG